MLTTITNKLRRFHDDEAGLEAIQVVLILAVAAIAMVIVKGKWQTIKSLFEGQMDAASAGWGEQ